MSFVSKFFGSFTAVDKGANICTTCLGIPASVDSKTSGRSEGHRLYDNSWSYTGRTAQPRRVSTSRTRLFVCTYNIKLTLFRTPTFTFETGED